MILSNSDKLCLNSLNSFSLGLRSVFMLVNRTILNLLLAPNDTQQYPIILVYS